MKKLFLIPVFLMIVSVASAQEIDMINLTGLITPIVLFIAASLTTIFVTKFVVNARMKEKQAKYEMLKKFAETGVQIPTEYVSDLSTVNQEATCDYSLKSSTNPNVIADRQRLMKELSVFKNGGIVALVFGFISFASVNHLPSDLFQLITGLILITLGSIGLYVYYKGINKR